MLSLTEALVVIVLGRDDIDVTNVVAKLRLARTRLTNLGYDVEADRTEDDADSIIIAATLGGSLDLFGGQP